MLLYSYCSCNLLLVLNMLSHIYVRTEGIAVIGNDTTAIYGEKVTLLCQLQLTETNEDLTRIIWKKKTREKPVETPFFVIRADGRTQHLNGLGDRVKFIGNFAEKNGSIQLLRMRILDEGIYTCTYSLYPSGNFEADINVTVFARPVDNVKSEEPVSGALETTLASCFASNARPAATVMWKLGDLRDSLKTETNHTVNDNGTITVASYLLGVPLKDLNKKKVQCVVNHITMNEDILSYTINIHYPPESVVITADSPTNAKEFICEVDSNPNPNYTWSRQNGRTPHYKGNTLHVPELTSDFNGLYICNASNKYGSSLGSLYINVQTESTTVCWGLFGFLFFIIAAAAVFAAIFKYKPEWIRGLIQVFQHTNGEREQSGTGFQQVPVDRSGVQCNEERSDDGDEG